METRREQSGEVAIVTPMDAHLDASNAGDFKQAMVPVLDTQNSVVLDLREVQFVDSSGLGAILSCLRQLNGKGGDLKLCGMTKPVHVLFELVRMHRVFDIFSNREDAVRAFSK